MASIQERLQMKRVPLDTWSTQEKLCLASSVIRSGDQNWMSVSRALRTLGDPGRPHDWFSQKNCAAQYGCLLENVETPRRKKRTADGATETPQESIIKKLSQQRILELHKEMAETAKVFVKIKDEVKELKSDKITEARIRELNVALEAAKREKERGVARRAQWLREREQRRGLLERAYRRAEGVEAMAGGPAPLLTSLLQSPGPHHHITEITSPSAGAPTLSLLLEKPIPSLQIPSDEPPMLQPISDHKVVSKSELLKIEQIKSELQEFEHQYRGSMPGNTSDVLNSMPPLTPVQSQEMTPSKESSQSDSVKTPEKIEIDDIEIKAEDVYAFSDIDLEIPPVSSIHKTPMGRTMHSDRNLFNKRDHSSSGPSLEDVASPSVSDSAEVINSLFSPMNMNENSNIEMPTESAPTIDEIMLDPESSQQPAITDSEVPPKSDTQITTEKGSNQMELMTDIEMKIEPEEEAPQAEVEMKRDDEDDSSDGEMNQKVADIKKDLEARKSSENLFEKPTISSNETESTIPAMENEQWPSEPEKINSQSDTKEQTSEPSQPEHPIEGHMETDDDTPIEVIKEDKPGKTKRDYSRKKTEKDDVVNSPAEIEGVVSNKSEYSDEIGSDNSQGSTDKKIQIRRFRNEVSMSRSESPGTPVDSLPGSPAPTTPPPCTLPPASPAPDQDREYRTWKKAILLAYSRLNTLKYASLFLRPITDDQAPGYSQVVKRPMDFSTIRKNIDNGIIKTTKEFQRDVLLMMNNALMYNRSDHRVHTMARETLCDVHTQLHILLQAQGHPTLGNPTSRLARPFNPLTRAVPPPPRRKRGGGETPTPN